MKYELVQDLCCPICRGSFVLTVASEKARQVESGDLTCEQRHRFPITRFVPRFVDTDKYADTFSVQRRYVRRHFEHYRRDRSGDDQFERTTAISDELLTQGTTLEIGCGYGRFLDVVQRRGGRIVGVDLSTHSVDLAQDFVGLRPGVDIVQADLYHLPFRPASFDRVFSIGVLHHTPDTRRSFEAIAGFAKDGGRVSIWVYHPDDKVSSNRWRHFTTRLDHRVLYAMCIANQVAFSWIRGLPGGWRFNALIPGGCPDNGRPFWMRVLGDFDDLSPTFAFVHRPEEVEQWFEALGFRDVKSLGRLTAVTGIRDVARAPVRAQDAASRVDRSHMQADAYHMDVAAGLQAGRATG
jgi:SAM-dependent methyltransferase